MDLNDIKTIIAFAHFLCVSVKFRITPRSWLDLFCWHDPFHMFVKNEKETEIFHIYNVHALAGGPDTGG
jgi:hypothetical protein